MSRDYTKNRIGCSLPYAATIYYLYIFRIFLLRKQKLPYVVTRSVCLSINFIKLHRS